METGTGAGQEMPAAIDKAIRYMSSHLGEKMTVNRVASAVGCHEIQL